MSSDGTASKPLAHCRKDFDLLHPVGECPYDPEASVRSRSGRTEGVSEDLAKWLRRRIEERRFLAQHAVELGNNAVWTEQSSGVLFFAEPTETDAWNGTWASGDSSVTRLAEANDPRDTIARCEAELGILDQHAHVPTRTGAYGTPFDFGCRTCDEMSDPDGNSDVRPDGWCETIRLLGYAYRFRDGYREAEWEPYLVTLAKGSSP